jgi:tetratricopeptide (TPR) repeat protein
MSGYNSLFLKTFNPCADRVEDIEKALRNELDEKASLELMDHIETCKRCHRYHGYMESVEQGFKNLPEDIAEISPQATKGLPATLQTEMIQAMKRNLAKWMFESARTIMHRQGMVMKFFSASYDLIPIKIAISMSNKIFHSVNNIIITYNTSQNQLTNAKYLINDLEDSNLRFENNLVLDILKYSSSMDNSNLYPYHYINQLHMNNNKYSLACRINEEALNNNPPDYWKSRLYNNMGALYHLQGMFDNAIKFYNKSVNYLDYIEPHINLGFVFINLNKLSDATDQLKIGINLIEHSTSNIIRVKYRSILQSVFAEHYKIHKETIKSNLNLANLFNRIRGFI